MTTNPAAGNGLKVALLYQKLAIPFIFEAAAREGIEFTLIAHPDEQANLPDAAIAQYPAIKSVHFVDIFSREAVALSSLRRIQEQEGFRLLLCFREEAIPFSAKAAQFLGLPYFNPPEVCFAARDKSIMRQKLGAGGCNTPRNTSTSDHDFEARLQELRFPVVVKPTSGFSSMGVIRADNARGLLRAIGKVRDLNRHKLAGLSRVQDVGYCGVIVEEYLEGPEFVAETFSVNGRHHVLSIGFKGHPQGPYFEESIYIAPPNLPDDVDGAIRSEVKRALSALGLANGPAHVELRLLDGRTPYVLEIGARIGGSGVSQFVVEQATGVCMLRLCVDLLLGAPMPAWMECGELKPRGYAGNYIIRTGEGGSFRQMLGLDDVKKHQDTRRILLFMQPRQPVRPYPDFTGYPGFILSTHGTWDEAMAYIDFLDATVRVGYEDGSPPVLVV